MEILRRGNSIKNSTESGRSDNTDEVIFFNYINNETKSFGTTGNTPLPYVVDNAASNLSCIENQEHDTWSSDNENISACDRKDELKQVFGQSSGDDGSLLDVSDDLRNDSILMIDDIVKGLLAGINNDEQNITKRGILFRSNSDSQLYLSNRQSKTTKLSGFNSFSTNNLRSRNIMSYLFDMSQKVTAISQKKKNHSKAFTKPFRKLRKYLRGKRKKITENC